MLFPPIQFIASGFECDALTEQRISNFKKNYSQFLILNKKVKALPPKNNIDPNEVKKLIEEYKSLIASIKKDMQHDTFTKKSDETNNELCNYLE